MNYFVNLRSIFIFAPTFIDKAKASTTKQNIIIKSKIIIKWKNRRTPTMKPLPNH